MAIDEEEPNRTLEQALFLLVFFWMLLLLLFKAPLVGAVAIFHSPSFSGTARPGCVDSITVMAGRERMVGGVRKIGEKR